MALKGLFTDFTWGFTEPFLAQEYGFLEAFLIFSIPMVAMVDFMVSPIGPIEPLLLEVDHFSPIIRP